MANANTPFGLCAVKPKYGTAPERKKYTVKASTTIYERHPVCLNTTGELVAYTNTLAAAGQVAGVIDQTILAADTDRTAYVLDDPKQQYEIMSSDDSLTVLTDWLGKIFRFTNLSTNNTTLQYSKTMLDGSTGTSVVTLSAASICPIVAVRQSDQIGHTDNTTYNRFVVEFIPQVHYLANPATYVT